MVKICVCMCVCGTWESNVNQHQNNFVLKEGPNFQLPYHQRRGSNMISFFLLCLQSKMGFSSGITMPLRVLLIAFSIHASRIFNRWHFYLHHQRIRYEADAQSSYSYISRGKTISYHGFTNTTNLKSRITEQATVEKAFNTWVSPWKPSRRNFLSSMGWEP